jgi:3-hydroxyisobutyrate dehydrogenase-like beta-hydroxyacid dehydrogenase
MTRRIGFVGLGTMGGPMAARLAAHAPLAVYDARSSATVRFEGISGVTVTSSPADAARAADVLFTCLPDGDAVRDVYLGANGIVAGAAPGLVTCDCSTISPETSVAIAAALAATDVRHKDTAMLGSGPQAVSGEIVFIVSGDQTVVPAIEPYLAMMGRLHIYVGVTGTAGRVKLAHNGLTAVVSIAVAEALATCVASGVDPWVFDEVVRNGGGMAFGTYFDRRVRRMLAGDFSPTFMTELMLKDVGLALDVARSADVPAPMLEEARRTYAEAVAAGWGKDDFSAVTHVIEERIGRRIGSHVDAARR